MTEVKDVTASARFSTASSKSPAAWNWLPLIALPIGAFFLRDLVPAWLFTWLMAGAIFFGCKWLTWGRARPNEVNPTLRRSLGYLFLWPGMDAPAFLAQSSEHSRADWETARLRIAWAAWAKAGATTVAGIGLVLLAGHLPSSIHPLIVGWLGMLGIVLFLHFGMFRLLALSWQCLGVDAQPVMNAPLRAKSLAEFWSTRWNIAFNSLAHELSFRPLVPCIGVRGAVLATFAVSGLVHELVISLPARGGFGLPTAYFVLQGLGVIFERSRLGRRLGLGRGFRGWCFVFLCAAGPAFWLFHPSFVRNVILPMLSAIGST